MEVSIFKFSGCQHEGRSGFAGFQSFQNDLRSEWKWPAIKSLGIQITPNTHVGKHFFLLLDTIWMSQQETRQ